MNFVVRQKTSVTRSYTNITNIQMKSLGAIQLKESGINSRRKSIP